MLDDSNDGGAVEAIGALVASFIAVSPEVVLDDDRLVFHGSTDLFELLVTRAVNAALQVVPSELLAAFIEQNRLAAQTLALVQ